MNGCAREVIAYHSWGIPSSSRTGRALAGMDLAAQALWTVVPDEGMRGIRLSGFNLEHQTSVHPIGKTSYRPGNKKNLNARTTTQII